MTGLHRPFVMKRQEIDPRFNKGNKLRPKYESPVDMIENAEQEPKRKAPKQTRLQPPMQNLSYDPRVHRGNMFHRTKVEDDSNHRQWRKIKKIRYSNTPEPIKGRQHMDIQTDMYLEDQSAKITYNDFDTQTDDFLDRPQTPYFIPWKSGPDVFTQIFLGDLFDFEMEVEPMVEVLAGRALEQGFMEVQEEKQLEHLRCHQDLFEQMRVAELTATQRMEAAERRIMDEKERRLKQEQARLKEEQLLRLRTEAMGIAMRVLKNITNGIYDKLTKEGYFYDPVEQELELHFIPILLKQMQTEIGITINSRHAIAIMADEAIPATDFVERAVDGIDIIMSKLMNVLDSWISFEDNVMVELAATEQASQRVMVGTMGEVVLVDHTSHDVTTSLIDNVEIAHTQGTDATRALMDLLLKGFDPQ